jgi:hypothetical protein
MSNSIVSKGIRSALVVGFTAVTLAVGGVANALEINSSIRCTDGSFFKKTSGTITGIETTKGTTLDVTKSLSGNGTSGCLGCGTDGTINLVENTTTTNTEFGSVINTNLNVYERESGTFKQFDTSFSAK